MGKTARSWASEGVGTALNHDNKAPTRRAGAEVFVACYASTVLKLLETIREECSPQTWSRAVQIARTGALTGKHGRDGSIEVRIATKGGMVSPLVTLVPDEGEWSCDCPSNEAVCQHVAAAVIALAQAEKDGTSPLGVKAAAGVVTYQLTSQDQRLALTRMIKRGEVLTPLTRRLTLEKQKGEASDVAPTRADLEIDILLGATAAGVLPRAFVPKVLTHLAECDDVTLDGRPVKIGDAVDAIEARVERDRDGFRLIAAKNRALSQVFENGAALVADRLCLLRDPELSDSDLGALKKGRHFALSEVADLVGRVIPALEQRIKVRVPKELLPGSEEIKPRIAVSADVLAGVLEVLPTIVYGDPPCARVDSGKLTYLGGPVPRRDVEAEMRLTRSLEEKLGLEVGRRRRLEGESAVRLAERVKALSDVHVTGGGFSAFTLRGELKPELTMHGKSVDLNFTSEDGARASGDAVVAAFIHGSPLVALDGGGFAPLPADFLRTHGHLIADLLAARDRESKELPNASVPDLLRLCAALDQPPPAELTTLRALIEDFTGIGDPALPSDLHADLRDYQRRGVSWLEFLRRSKLGALLADDMGLGKTLQTICVLEGRSLVVCPASVLFNWAAEIARFRPSLRVATYHGQGRELDPQADITLTTYAIMRLDASVLSQEPWRTVVLDEAQTIKNPDSQVAQAAYELNADFRIALTGTPVENRLSDLWSLFHFLNRGLLSGRSDFVERYEKPISEGDRSAAMRLRERVKPFILRRMKREVAKELPPRTDVVLRCTLDADERALYDSVLAATRKEVLEGLAQGGNVLAMLEALLRLRQACCHRALLPGQNTVTRSSKLELVLETLEEALSEGHKALVFSQWTSLLDLVEPMLKARNIRFTRLDGSTPDRGAVVKEFQEDAGVPVMLLSLKAGGTGLNLTAADHVFLLDPWWNPAAEDQAADRAHRIGQERPVLVHRLITENTVEERILALQEKKRALSAVATDGASEAAGITREDLLALLA